MTLADSPRDVRSTATDLVSVYGGQIGYIYRHALSGFSLIATGRVATLLGRDPRVTRVEEDGVAEIADGNPTPLSWGLDRIDQRESLDHSYRYQATGQGSYAFVLDTGVRRSHTEFGGRVIDGFDAVNDGGGGADCNGHGTHVAGTIGGATYGVAKLVTVINVRVLGCNGRGSWSQVIAGIDWVAGQAILPAVANLSIEGTPSATLDEAINNSVSSGISYVVAAGNGDDHGDAVDACGVSPARAASAITVSATDAMDEKPTWANHGSCVDLFAPGVDVPSAWHNSDRGTNSLSGTSMATPHVTGVVAQYLGLNPSASPSSVSTMLLSNATKDLVAHAGPGSPNRLLYQPAAQGSGGWIVRASVGPIGQRPLPSTGCSCGDAPFRSVISGDGRFVGFATSRAWLGMDGTDRSRQAFIRDMTTGEVTLVSVSNGGRQADAGAGDPQISDDGRFAAFASTSTNLAPDGSSTSYLYVRDTVGRRTYLASRDIVGDPISARFQPYGNYLSADGTRLLFIADCRCSRQIPVLYLYDVRTERSSYVPIQTSDGQLLGIERASLAADGRYVVFVSASETLPGANGHYQVYRADVRSGETVMVSVSASGAPGDDDSGWETAWDAASSLVPAASADGRYVAFPTRAASNLGASGLVVRDMVERSNEHVRFDLRGNRLSGSGGDFSFSRDGRKVVFGYSFDDLLLRDLDRDLTLPAGVTSAGELHGGRVPAVDATGRFISFYGWRSTIIPGDAVVRSDIFVKAMRPDEALPTTPTAITVASGGTGSGSVTSDPSGIECSSCVRTFSYGSAVTLTATPAEDSTFTGWSGDCVGNSTCGLLLTAPRTVTARFTAKARLTVSKEGNGAGSVRSTPSGVDCGDVCSEAYPHGTIVELTAEPASSSHFAGWFGACSGNGPCRVTMDRARSVVGRFSIRTFTLTVGAEGLGSGTISSAASHGIDCGSICAGTFPFGASVNLVASPDEDSTFAGWQGDCIGTDECNVTMDRDRSVNATFRSCEPGANRVVLFSDEAWHGNCHSFVVGDYEDLEPFQLMNAASAAMVGEGVIMELFEEQSLGGAHLSRGGDDDSFHNDGWGDRGRSLRVKWKMFELEVRRVGAGSGRVVSVPGGISCGATCAATFAHGTRVRLSASPAASSTFAGWSGPCSGRGACTVTMSQAALVTATFVLRTYTLSVGKKGSGSGYVHSSPSGIACGRTCRRAFTHGAVVELRARAGSGFAGWSGACRGRGVCRLTMTGTKQVWARFDRR